MFVVNKVLRRLHMSFVCEDFITSLQGLCIYEDFVFFCGVLTSEVVGRRSQADCPSGNTAMDDSIGGS